MSDAAWALQTARQVGPISPPHAHARPIHKLHTGPLHSSVAGRTDHLPTNVPNGAYVLPADIVSARARATRWLATSASSICSAAHIVTLEAHHMPEIMGHMDKAWARLMAWLMAVRSPATSAPIRGAGTRLTHKQYDKRYYDIAPDHLEDESGNVVGTRQKAVAKAPFRDRLEVDADPNTMYRGMSHAEYENFKKEGHIKSAGSHNFSNQSGLTYWTSDPQAAETYANSFAPRDHKPTWDKPAYVVAAKRAANPDIRHVEGVSDHELGVTRPVGANEVSAVYRGNVVHYDPGSKTVSPSARPNWEQIHPQVEQMASGGQASGDQGVPVAVAGGEHVLAPHEVAFAGMGDMDMGHRALDEFVLRQRAKTVKTLKGLPGPKRD